ncbi:MAG: DNA primase [Phycisphaeraceae bacterium]
MNLSANNDRERVLASTDIVRLIGEHVQLRPKGREFAGLCPFHDDKNPSMQVSPQKQIYKCFSCGAGGDPFSFVMDYHKLTFPEAMKMLADRAGIELTPFRPGKGGGTPNPQNTDRRKRLLAVNELALAFFQQQLQSPDAEAVRAYLDGRGVSAEMIERFQLGYAPHSWHALAEAVAQERWDKPAFEAAGLIAKSNKPGGAGGNCYDKLRHRLIFPICDDMGRAIAFGGRTLPGNELDDPTVDAKYLNSPETLLFNKSRTLYGLDLAKKAIIDAKTAVIVEGYTDVIACHQHERCNVVAALGTAFTAEHATKLRRFCEKVVLVFDGDAAGLKAADRAVEVLLTSEIDVAVVILPEGKDPDELLAQDGGAAAWDALIDRAPGAMAYLLAQFADDLSEADTMAGKQDLATAFLTRLARHDIAAMPSIRRALVVARLAQLLHLPEHEVLAELKRLKPRTFAPPIPSADATATTQAGYGPDEVGPVMDEAMPDYAENEQVGRPEPDSSFKLGGALALAQRQLVACLIRDNDLFHSAMPDGADFCESVPPGDVAGDAGRVYQLLHDRFADGQTLTLSGLLAELAERGWHEDRRWLTQADLELEPQIADDPDRLKRLFTDAAQAIARHRRNKAHEQDRRSLVAGAQDNPDPLAKALALAEQAQRLAQQRRNEDDPGRIARTT